MIPDTQQIPVGLGTKLGVLAAAISSLVAAIFAIADGDHSPETITALIVAGSLVYGVVKGRMDQAAALSKPTPSVIVNTLPQTDLEPVERLASPISSPPEPSWSAADYDDEPEPADTEDPAAAKVPVHTGPISDLGDDNGEGGGL